MSYARDMSTKAKRVSLGCDSGCFALTFVQGLPTSRTSIVFGGSGHPHSYHVPNPTARLQLLRHVWGGGGVGGGRGGGGAQMQGTQTITGRLTYFML